MNWKPSPYFIMASAVIVCILMAIRFEAYWSPQVATLRAERDAARDSLAALRSAVRVPQLLDAYGIPYTIMVGDSAAMIHYGWSVRRAFPDSLSWHGDSVRQVSRWMR